MPGKWQPAWLASLDQSRSVDDAEQEAIAPLVPDMNLVAKNSFLISQRSEPFDSAIRY